MSTKSITVSGYDPFDSPYDYHDDAIVGGVWGSIKGAAKGAAKGVAHVAVDANPVVMMGKTAVRAAVTRSPAAVYNGLIGDAKGAVKHSMNLMRSQGGRVLAGAALAFPPTAPAAAGVIAANQVLDALGSRNKATKKAAALTLIATKKSRRPESRNAWAAVRTAHAMRKRGVTIPTEVRDGESAASVDVFDGMLFTTSGLVVQGRWRRA